ncbi:hypothetical protein HK096_009546, partial [Nowakowskiella sp. JEL0078]
MQASKKRPQVPLQPASRRCMWQRRCSRRPATVPEKRCTRTCPPSRARSRPRFSRTASLEVRCVVSRAVLLSYPKPSRKPSPSCCIRLCAIDPAKEVRANAFRVLRHIITTDKLAELVLETHLDVFVVKALTRDARYDLEREQALKYVRGLIDIPDGVESISPAIMRVLISISEQPDDKFRNICLETICEISLRNVKIVAECGGLKSLIGTMLESPPDLSEVLIMCLVNVLDIENTREYFRPSVELEMIISSFTDVSIKGSSPDDKLLACAKAVTSILRSWTGLIYLCVEDKRAIKSIVDAIYLPQEEIR